MPLPSLKDRKAEAVPMDEYKVAVVEIVRNLDGEQVVWQIGIEPTQNFQWGFSDKAEAEIAYLVKAKQLPAQAKKEKRTLIVVLCHLLAEGRISMWAAKAAGFKHAQWAKEAEEDFTKGDSGKAAGTAIFDLHPAPKRSGGAKKSAPSKDVGADLAPKRMVKNHLAGKRPA